MKLHIHFNHPGGTETQVCALSEDLEVGQTAVVHLHEVPDACQVCRNGHCHAPNITVARVKEDEFFVGFEGFPAAFHSEVVALPGHAFRHEEEFPTDLDFTDYDREQDKIHARVFDKMRRENNGEKVNWEDNS